MCCFSCFFIGLQTKRKKKQQQWKTLGRFLLGYTSTRIQRNYYFSIHEKVIFFCNMFIYALLWYKSILWQWIWLQNGTLILCTCFQMPEVYIHFYSVNGLQKILQRAFLGKLNQIEGVDNLFDRCQKQWRNRLFDCYYKNALFC